jgi:hypothetical protein
MLSQLTSYIVASGWSVTLLYVYDARSHEHQIFNILGQKTLAFENHLPEDVHRRPRRVGSVSYVYELLSFYCCTVAEIHIVKPQLTIEDAVAPLPSMRLYPCC